jgi:hypothetical protein
VQSEERDWSRTVVDHLDLHASDFSESARVYKTISNGEPGYRDYGPGYYAAYLLDPGGNNVEALYHDIGNPGHTG